VDDDQQHHDSCQDHEVGIEEKHDARVIEAPLALQAAGCLCHAPRSHQQSKRLPRRSVQVLDVREPRQTQTGGKRAQREKNRARQRFLPYIEEIQTKPHNLPLYRGGTGRFIKG
jgi:hypothetical protein